MSFPPLHLIVEDEHTTLLVAGLVHETMPTDENIHTTAIDKAFEIVTLHGKDLPLTIIDHGKEYSMILTKNGETIDTTPGAQPTKTPKRKTVKILVASLIALSAATLTVGYFLHSTTQQVTQVNTATPVKQVSKIVPWDSDLPIKSPTTSLKTPTTKEIVAAEKKEKEKQATEAKKKAEEEAKKKAEADAAKRKADEAKPQAQQTTNTPQPAPTPVPPPVPRPAPTPQPAPPAPAPTNFITDMSTEASSFSGSVTFTVRFVGGNAPVTASIAGKTITFNNSGTITGIPKGTYTWTTSADGLSNSGTITIP